MATDTPRSSLTPLQTLAICGGILVVAGLITAGIFLTEPQAQSSGAVKESAMLVEVTSVQPDTVRPVIRSMGTVRPVDDVVLSPRVEGRVVEVATRFDPGRDVQAGDVLLRIDPSDYRNTLRQRESELQQAESDLQLEMGRQNIARQDYELLADTLSDTNRDLVLRQPQLRAARSRVESARAAADQARLNLERTTIRAPFDAHILERNVSVGSQVQSGTPLARLVGRDRYWVEATVPLAQVQRLATVSSLDEARRQGSVVRIRNRTAWPADTYRSGYLARRVGALENDTRMARILIAVPDPGAMQPERSGQPPLVLGSFVEAHLPAEPLANVVRLDRDYLRSNDTVWLMDGDSLRIQPVDVVMKDAEYAYVGDGLDASSRVITSSLATVREGAPLRLSPDTSRPDTSRPDTSRADTSRADTSRADASSMPSPAP